VSLRANVSAAPEALVKVHFGSKDNLSLGSEISEELKPWNGKLL